MAMSWWDMLALLGSDDEPENTLPSQKGSDFADKMMHELLGEPASSTPEKEKPDGEG